MRSVAAVCFTLALPTVVFGQQQWDRQVHDRMQRAITAIGTSSPSTVQQRSGALNLDESESFQATLMGRTAYTIIAVCDDDCTRLQLTLLKTSGSEIAQDRDSESLPTLHFTSDTTTLYRIRVTMEGCRWNPCRYAVAVVPLSKNRH